MPSRRYVTVTLHGGRPAAVSAAAGFIAGMAQHGITSLVKGDQLQQFASSEGVAVIRPE